MLLKMSPLKRGLAILVILSVTLTKWPAEAQTQLTIQNELTPLTPLTGQQRPTQNNNNIQNRFSQSPQAQKEVFLSLANSVQKFGFKAFNIISYNYPTKDIMISPFAVWALWILLLEGSKGKTYSQIHDTLNINTDRQHLRQAFKIWRQHLNINTPTVSVASLQAIYYSHHTPVQSDYASIIGNFGGVLNQADFGETQTYDLINRDVERATRGLIKSTVLPQDLINAKMYMFSSLYFKGQWRHPFNKSLTRYETFYDENERPLGQVEMMVQEEHFVYTGQVPKLNAYVLELPYGKENRLSMLVIYPKRGQKLFDIAATLQDIGIQPILAKLEEASDFDDSEVEVVMPKFTTSSDLKLKQLLEYMGIRDAFNSSAADLTGIGEDLFVKDCVHTAKIIVDEEGTTAAAVASAVLINKTSPTKFVLNKPFIYLIIEKTTQLLLFAGHVVNPIQ